MRHLRLAVLKTIFQPFISCQHILVALISTTLALAGAQSVVVVVDDDDGSPAYTETGSNWQTSSTPGYNGGTYRFTEVAGQTARWTPTFPHSGMYNVSVVFRGGHNRPESVVYQVRHATGQTNIGISQLGDPVMREVPLGTYSFVAGFNPSNSVTVVSAASAATIADAVIFRTAIPGAPPSITEYVRMPGKVDHDTPVSIRGRIASASTITSAAITYTVYPSGAETTVQAFDDGSHGDLAAGDGIYGATIPPHPNGTSVSVFIRAWDTENLEGRTEPRTYHVGRYPAREFRAIWADSWNDSFLNPAQANEFVDTARAANINLIMPEVRKVGDAYYNSALEPRATNISGPPGWDPLQHLIDRAHDTTDGKRIEVHAWFVMNRIANSAFLHPDHVLMKHPEYEMLKRDGTTGSTRYLDPGHPGAADFNVAVVLDCVANYDIDGYHFDYIRYPEIAGEWGYNPVSVARFNAVHGRTGIPEDWDPLWRAWRRECVSLMVKKIYVKAWKIKPHVLSTAATVNWGWSYDDFTQSSAYSQVFQDWSGWLQDGIIDYNSLMSYARLTDPARHQGWSWRSISDSTIRGSIIGVGVYLTSSIAGAMDMIHYARSSGAEGINIYDWGSEVQSNSLGESREDFYQALKDEVFTTWVDTPDTPWRSSPVTGIFEGNVLFDGQPVDHARVRIKGMPETETVTDGSGWYAILHVLPGQHTVEVIKNGVGVQSRTVSATIPSPGEIVTVDVALDITSVDDWGLY